MNKKKSVRDVEVAGKRVLMRVDFNVTRNQETGEISDDTRIKAALPTLRYLVDRQCKIVLCSHLGRPKGKYVEDLRLATVTERLSMLLGKPVVQLPDCVGPAVRRAVDELKPGGLLMLENLRFHPGEESNDPEFVASLSALADVFVNDAFGAAHRAHASINGVAHALPAISGLLMERELEMLSHVMECPRRPFAAVLGGAKISDKLCSLMRLAHVVDTLIVGGGMAATLLKSKGLEVGESLMENDQIEDAGELIRTAEARGLNLLLPTDVVVAESFSAHGRRRVVGADEIPPTWRIMDIGPDSASMFERAVSLAKTVVWNGPLGVFEWEPFARGTTRVAEAIASLTDATTVIGGGSTAAVVNALGLADRMTHVSTGGGASLEYMEGKELPGIAALMDKDDSTIDSNDGAQS